LKYRPQWPEAQANLALAYSGLGDRSQAERIDEKMLEADPKSADALRGRAAIAIQTSDLDAGLKLHVRLIGLGERSAEVLYNAGAHVRKSGPARQSFEVLSESPRRKPDTPEALLNPGRILEAPENRQKPEPAGLVAWQRNRPWCKPISDPRSTKRNKKPELTADCFFYCRGTRPRGPSLTL